MHSLSRDEQWVLEEKYGGLRNPRFEADRKRLTKGEPVAYVIGWQPFLGLKIWLDSKPLIPRPETEWWVEQLIAQTAEQTSTESGCVPQGDGPRPSDFSAEKYATPRFRTCLRILDLCAGSGVIGCALLHAFPTAEVYFSEIDPEHRRTIEKNITMNGLDASRTHIGIGDLFEPFGDTRFDVVACNPPYIPTGRELPASVTGYESTLALYAGEDGLDLVRRIAEELPARLAPGGQAWVECDSAHAEEARSLFEALGMAAKIRTDQYGAPRLVVVTSG